MRAAYVVNILRLSERRIPLPGSPDLMLCLIAPGPVEQPLRTLEGALIRGRRLRIRLIADSEMSGCEALFFGHSSGCRPVLAKAHALGLLTIGNDRDFVLHSGMIALVVENHRVVVEVNERAVKNGDWVLSSHLLEVARIVAGEAP